MVEGIQQNLWPTPTYLSYNSKGSNLFIAKGNVLIPTY